MEFIVDPDTAMQDYLLFRVHLFILILLNLFFELALTIYIYRNREYIIIRLNQTNRGYKRSELEDLVDYGTYLNATFNLF